MHINVAVNEAIVSLLQKELDIKNEQIKELHNQISELNQRLAEAHQIADQTQRLHSADKVLALEDGKKKKKWFWQRD